MDIYYDARFKDVATGNSISQTLLSALPPIGYTFTDTQKGKFEVVGGNIDEPQNSSGKAVKAQVHCRKLEG